MWPKIELSEKEFDKLVVDDDDEFTDWRDARKVVEGQSRVEYIDGKLPKLVFTWSIILESSDGRFAVGPANSLTLCNFRRYAWSWANGHAAKHGYRGGVEYCNGHGAGFSCKTPEGVVTTCLAKALADLVGSEGVPREMVYNKKVRPLIDRLLADALENISEQHAVAPMRRNNGYIWDGTVG